MSLFLENYLCYSEIFQISTLNTLLTITKSVYLSKSINFLTLG